VGKSQVALVLALVLAALVGGDLVRTLRTGRAHGKFGTITRAKQPARFWRYVYGDYALLVLCAVMLLWSLISPASFG
jgi:hypothetical protein